MITEAKNKSVEKPKKLTKAEKAKIAAEKKEKKRILRDRYGIGGDKKHFGSM